MEESPFDTAEELPGAKHLPPAEDVFGLIGSPQVRG